MSPSLRFAHVDWFESRRPVWESLLAPLRGRPNQILEIGSYEGRSAVWIAQNLLEHPGAFLTCIDPCLDVDVATNLRHNLDATGRAAQIRLITSRSSSAYPMVYYHPVDFVYVDGSHEAPDVFFDAAMSFEILKPGGLLCFDDYLWSKQLDGTVHAPQLAINAFAACYAERIELVHRDAQAWFRKK